MSTSAGTYCILFKLPPKRGSVLLANYVRDSTDLEKCFPRYSDVIMWGFPSAVHRCHQGKWSQLSAEILSKSIGLDQLQKISSGGCRQGMTPRARKKPRTVAISSILEMLCHRQHGFNWTGCKVRAVHGK